MYTNLNNPANYQLQGFDQYGFRILPAGMSGTSNINEPLDGGDQYRSILALEDSVISATTLHGDNISNKTLLAGEQLDGLFLAIEVLSGEVAAFLAGPVSTPEASEIWFNFDGAVNYTVFPDNSFSLPGDFCFGVYIRPWTTDRARQVILMADSFSIEIRGKYLYVINAEQETKVTFLRTGEWIYISVNVSGTNLTVYAAEAYTLSNGVLTVFDNTYTFTINAVDLSSVSKLRIASDLNNDNLFYGNFAHFGFWNRTLSLAEVLVIRPLSITTYPAAQKVDLVHFYEFSYWLAFGVTALATDKILVSPINGTINGL